MPISKPPFVNLCRSKFSEVIKLTLTSLSALFSSADPERLWGELVACTWACCRDRSWLGCLVGERFEQRLGFRAGQKCCAVFTDSSPEFNSFHLPPLFLLHKSLGVFISLPSTSRGTMSQPEPLVWLCACLVQRCQGSPTLQDHVCGSHLGGCICPQSPPDASLRRWPCLQTQSLVPCEHLMCQIHWTVPEVIFPSNFQQQV